MFRNHFLLVLQVVIAVSVGTVPAVGNAACTAGNPSSSVIEATPTADFTVDSANGTVTHTKTGLMWKRCAEGQSGTACATGTATAMNWAQALATATAANAANGGAGFAGHKDWRLPNRKELLSIVEPCGFDPSINQEMFPATPPNYSFIHYFWSASSAVSDPASAWIVVFMYGTSNFKLKSNSNGYVRLVRGGQSVDSFDLLLPYSVTYVANGATGGTAPVDSTAYASGATVTTTNEGTLARTGTMFTVWNTAADGTGTAYGAKTTFTIAGNTTLYAQWRAVGLPDTGQALCDSGTNTLVPCTVVNSNDAATYPRQDGRFGRDAKSTAGTLTKVGAGAAGFDYTKLANNGSDLAAGAPLGTGATNWACTRDNVTGLTWEVKTAGATSELRNYNHTYTWYSTDTATNGGNAGSTGGNTCNSTLAGGQCNTQAYVAAVNAAALCGYTDWRLPTIRELATIVNRGTSNPSIDVTYFPHTQVWSFWSASSSARDSAKALLISFVDGWYQPFVKTSNGYARLVRGGHF